jgi:hypothetical protein
MRSEELFSVCRFRIGMIGAVQLEGLIEGWPLCTPKECLAPAAIPATLTNNLTLAFPKPTKPNQRCVTTVPINRLLLVSKCDCGSYAAHIDPFACNRIRRQPEKASI